MNYKSDEKKNAYGSWNERLERHDIFKNAQVNAMEARRREILGSVDRAKVENYYRIDSIVVRPP